MLKAVLAFLLLFALAGKPAMSATYYVAPLGTTLAGASDGTQALPFLSIDAALASGRIRGGDTLLLKDGVYGGVTIKWGASFDVPVTIMSQNAKAAHFDFIHLQIDTRNLILRNLSVWPRNPLASEPYLVRGSNTVSNITVEGLDIRGDQAAANFMQWDAAKWQIKYWAILLEGTGNIVKGNTITGVYEGIFAGNNAQVLYNSVDGFEGDALRGSSDTVLRGNRVSNCIAVSDNHDDGFQSFASAGSSVSNLVLDGNTIIEWTGAPDHPLRCTLQGIGMFKGPYVNTTITNNLIVVSHSHGISVYGANGAKITNNTIVNIFGQTGSVPYLAVQADPDGTPARNVLAANNLAMSIVGAASTTNNVVFRNNSLIGQPAMVFENPAAYDFRPKAASGWVDTGSLDAPLVDIKGQPRPSGVAPDRGAYELQAGGTTTTTTTDTSTGTTGTGTTTTTDGGTTTTTDGGTTTTTDGTTSPTSSPGPKRLKPPKRTN